MSFRTEYRRRKAARALAERQALRGPRWRGPVFDRTTIVLRMAAACAWGAACLLTIAGPLWIPSLESARVLDGVVSDSTYHRGSSRGAPSHYVMRLRSVDASITLFRGAPLIRLPDRLPVGANVQLRVSRTPLGNYWLWQAERDGERIVNYRSVRQAEVFRLRLAAGLVAVGTGAWLYDLRRLALSRRRREGRRGKLNVDKEAPTA
jgi:hypothetical protein